MEFHNTEKLTMDDGSIRKVGPHIKIVGEEATRGGAADGVDHPIFCFAIHWG